MKVAMVYPHPDSEKGISAYSLNLIKNIKKKGVDITGVPFLAGNPFSLLKKLPALFKYDSVHIQHEYNLLGWFGFPYFLILAILGIFKKKNLIVTMHTVLSQSEKFRSGKLKTFLRKILYKIQNRWINLFASKIIVHARFFKEILATEYSVPKEKISVLPHSILEGIQTITKEKARKELNLSGNVYLLIGTMVPDHGHDIVINQADKIGKLILVATNPSAINDRNEGKISGYLMKNKEVVKEKRLDKFVRFDIGPISNEKWWKYFSAADLILLPYRGGIGSGIFADAMVMKKPVVSSNVKYFKEFAKDYGCIEIAKTDSDFPRAIKHAMGKEVYSSMVKEAKRFAIENGTDNISKKYKELYYSINAKNS